MEGYFTFTIFLLGLSRISNAVTCQYLEVYMNYRSQDNDSNRPCLTCIKFTLTDKLVNECICDLDANTIDSNFFDDVYNKYDCKILDIKRTHFDSVILETAPSDEWSNLEYFDLSKNDINVLTLDFFQSLSNLKILLLSGNNLTSLDNNVLAPLSMLQNLDLSQNSITELDEPFKSLNDLFQINLGYNKITKISPNTFKSQEYLEYLILKNNRITTFENSFPLKPMPNSLITLDLSWNEIKNISLPGNIDSLDISHNNLVEFSINLSSSLISLNLSHNKIAKIGDSALLGAVNLETIDLSFNYLQSFPTSSFKDQDFLKQIDISNNLFSKNKYGPHDNWASFFLHCKQLESVSLVNNLWACSDLKDILQSLDSRSVNITHGNEHMANNILGIKCIELDNGTNNTPIDVSDISSRITGQLFEEIRAKMESYMLKSLNNISSRVSNLENNMVDKIGNIEKRLNTDYTEKDTPTYDNNRNTLQAVVLSELSSKIKNLEADKGGKENSLKNELNTIEQLLRSANDHSISGATIIQTLLLSLVVCILSYFLYVTLKKNKVVTRETLNLV